MITGETRIKLVRRSYHVSVTYVVDEGLTISSGFVIQAVPLKNDRKRKKKLFEIAKILFPTVQSITVHVTKK